MPILNSYRLWCSVDAKFVEASPVAYQETGPTTCFENAAHGVDASKTVITGTIGDDASPMSADGNPLVSLGFGDSNGLDPKWWCDKYTATAGALSIFDTLITTERRLGSGWFQLMNGAAPGADDYVEFSVVDKDDVLGYFSAYGLTVGVDVLELKKYVITEYTDTPDQAKEEFLSERAFVVAAGLYFRTYYNSGGGTDVPFKTRVLTFE